MPSRKYIYSCSGNYCCWIVRICGALGKASKSGGRVSECNRHAKQHNISEMESYLLNQHNSGSKLRGDPLEGQFWSAIPTGQTTQIDTG